MQLLETPWVNTFVMWRKLLIIHLLSILALLPVAQAISPAVSSGETGTLMHDLVVMDCGQVDPNHCVDFDTCTSGGHSNCDTKTKSTLLLPTLPEYPDRQAYNAHPLGLYLSHHAELFLRPPRNA